MNSSKINPPSVRSLGIALVVGLSLLGSEKAIADQPKPVKIVLMNSFTSPTTTAGPFTATGGLNVSGTDAMDVMMTDTKNPLVKKLHCKTVLTTAEGTFTIHMHCHMIIAKTGMTAGGPGRWVIAGGTGAYGNLRGEGILSMDIIFPTAALPAGKAWETQIGFVVFDDRR
jgi:hypothetical protein